MILDRFGAPVDEKLAVVSLSFKTFGAEVFVALIGSKLVVKTMDVTGAHNGNVAISWNICNTL